MQPPGPAHPLMRYASPAGPRSRVDQVVEDVRRWLLGDRVTSATRLPSVREMAALRGVSPDTIARAYDKLVALGHLEARRGSGFYVRGEPRRKAPAAPALVGWSHSFSKWRELVLQAPLADERLIGSGHLPADWLDAPLLERALRQAARQPVAHPMRHGEVAGLQPLRQQVALQLAAQHIHTDADHLVLTHGASDALHLVLHAFSSPSSAVLVEDPGNFALAERLASVNQPSVAVARQDDGPDLEQLRQLCSKHRPRLFFLSSLAHNPTSSSLSPHKAFQLLKLAEEFDLLLVDDDSYGDLVPMQHAASPVRLAALDQLQRVLHIGSFSKLLGAQLRVGYVAASAERAHILCQHKGALCIATATLPEQVVLRALTDGAYRHHVEQVRARLDRRRPQVLAWLRRCGFTVWHEATAGLYLWVDLGRAVDARVLAERALAGGRLLAPGLLFTTNEAWQSFMRVNVAAPFREADLQWLARSVAGR